MRDGLPDFLIIGAPKSGTTSLYSYLRSHPQIFMSRVKEPHYFASPGRRPAFGGVGGRQFNQTVIWRSHDYARLFVDRGEARMAGEASPTYLWFPDAPAAIARSIPDARLLVILRNPADRAYSHFCHNRRLGREPLADFRAALDDEPRRIADGWHPSVYYRARGRYGEQLERYLARFPCEQLKVFLYEDLKSGAATMLSEICRFLDVDPAFQFDTGQRYNATNGLPRRVWLSRAFIMDSPTRRAARRILPERVRSLLFERLYQTNLRPVPPLDPALRSGLLDGFREDIAHLQALIGRDLGHWLDG